MKILVNNIKNRVKPYTKFYNINEELRTRIIVSIGVAGVNWKYYNENTVRWTSLNTFIHRVNLGEYILL